MMQQTPPPTTTFSAKSNPTPRTDTLRRRTNPRSSCSAPKTFHHHHCPRRPSRFLCSRGSCAAAASIKANCKCYSGDGLWAGVQDLSLDEEIMMMSNDEERYVKLRVRNLV
ncbi:hypothetical protein Droror1_Dr00014254 [Drosera rotundifolia]